jgi:hypothetical protein
MNYNEVNMPEVIANWEKWWNGELGRPLACVKVAKAPESLTTPPMKCEHFTVKYGFDTPAEKVIESATWQLSCSEYHGDAFPSFWANFGPGVEAVLVGGEGEVDENTVWFYPGRFKDMPIEEMKFQFDPECQWFKRIEELSAAAVNAWGDKVVTCMTDIGGALDVLSSFRPGEMLLFDLYDNPEEVKRLCKNIDEEWIKIYDRLDAVIRPQTGTSSCWAGILSSGKCYMQQCDFAYMISPEMFEEFVKPSIEYVSKRLDRAFYHLDGIGQIPHIKHLCDIPELAGIQWIPGDGQRPADEWPEVMRKIEERGKKIQIYVSTGDQIRRALEAVKDPSCIQFGMGCDQQELPHVREVLADYGVSI